MKAKQMIQKSLAPLLDFTNADIKPLDESEFIGLIVRYAQFVSQYESRYRFLNYRGKYNTYVEGLLDSSSQEALEARKEFFLQLQEHFRLRFQTIINASTSNADEEETLIQMKGSRKVRIN